MTTRTFIAAAALAVLTAATGCDASTPIDDSTTTSQAALEGSDADACLEQCADLPCQGPGGEVWASDGRLYCNLCELQCLGLHVDKDAYYFQTDDDATPTLAIPTLDAVQPTVAPVAGAPSADIELALDPTPSQPLPAAAAALVPDAEAVAATDCLRECEALPCQGPGGETCGSDGMIYCNLCEIRCLGLTVRKNAFCDAQE